jgi:hypothetical protein
LTSQRHSDRHFGVHGREGTFAYLTSYS